MNRPPIAARPALFLAVLLSSGCVTQTASRYPSLQPREIERRNDAEPTEVATVAEPDAALDQTLTAQAKALSDSQAAFAAAADAAERAARAARGEPVGSDRWIAAQGALAKLDTFRATTSTIDTDLDELAINRARDAKPPYPTLDALKTQADGQLTAQVDRIATIQALLPGQ